MRITVHVKPSSNKNVIISTGGGVYKINIKAPCKEGKANLELVKFLTKEFKKPVKLVSGFKSKIKVVEID